MAVSVLPPECPPAKLVTRWTEDMKCKRLLSPRPRLDPTPQCGYDEERKRRRKAAVKKYDDANREKKREHEKLRRAANVEKERERHAAYQKANREKVRANVRNRKARRKAAEGSHTSEDIHRIHTAQKGKCAYCREKLTDKYHVDHIISLKAGGSNWPRNLQILCAPCNQGKNAKDPLEHMRQLGFLL